MKRSPILGGISALLAATVAVLIPATSASAATSVTIDRVIAPGATGIIYLEGPGGYCFQPGTNRTKTGFDFDENGSIGIAGGGRTLRCDDANGASLRVEAYPSTIGTECTGPAPERIPSINPFVSPAGGMHMNVSSGASIGTLTFPTQSTGGIKPMGKVIRAAGPTPSCKIHVEIFQGEGFALGTRGAFNAFYANHNDDTTTGWIFPGSYNVFIEDEVTGTKIRTLASFDASSRFDIDVDASCFGFDVCVYEKGGPPTTGGGFHPLSPARVLDTRSNIGIAGKVTAGDGSLREEPNPDMRHDALINHQTKVTGVGGVPEHGVSAVLLNVTAAAPDADSFLSVYPKLPRVNDGGLAIFNDQGGFRTGPGTSNPPSFTRGSFGYTERKLSASGPGTSNLNFRAGQTLPNLVLARVGAGGRIMVENFGGNVDVIADVVGWVDTGTGGDGFTGVTPERLLDTRQVGQGPIFGPNDTRHLKVTGRAGVPADATAVVLNVTQIDATTYGYMTVWPTGLGRPNTSNLNGAPGRIRPNLVVSKIGEGGQVDIFNYDGNGHVAVDVVGYFSARGGGQIYPLSPSRLMDSRNGFGTPKGPFDATEVRNLTVTGVGGVPSDAKAVIVNVTGTQSTSGSFLTVFPTGDKLPTTSNVNLDLGDPAPNLVMMKVGAGGQISISNDRGLAHVIVDVMGFVR
jgi:hypothetical protein